MLSIPINEINEIIYANKKIMTSVCSKIGPRDTNEDNHLIELVDKGESSALALGVFDGHSGDEASKYCKRHLFENIKGNEKFMFKDEDKIKEGITESFLETDDRLYQDQPLGTYGTTVSLVIMRDNKYYACNAGDSRIVLSRNKDAIDLSEDHKPYIPRELNRITSLGGMVFRKRIFGDLAVSRGIGDFYFKMERGNDYLAKKFCNKIIPITITGDLVSSVPDIVVLDFNEQLDDFLIVACDGLWDVLTSQEAVDYVYKMIDEDHSLIQISECLVDYALKKGSYDNVSVVLAFFKDIESLRGKSDGFINNNEIKSLSTFIDQVPPCEKVRIDEDQLVGLRNENQFEFKLNSIYYD